MKFILCVVLCQLPKIEAQLRELVNEYEAKTGKTFTIDGKPLLQYIQDEWESRKTVSDALTFVNTSARPDRILAFFQFFSFFKGLSCK